jgi:hypothetical protein
VVKNLNQGVDNWPFDAEFLGKLSLHHGPDDLHVDRNVDTWAVEFIEVVHGLWLSVGSHDDLDVFGEIFWEPEWDVAFLVGATVDKVVDAFEDENDLAEDFVNVFDNLAFDFLVADIQPVSKVVPEFFLVEFDFLSNVEFLSELDQNPVNGIVVVGVVAASCSKMQNNQVVLASRLHQLLVVLEPLDQ